MPNGMGNDKYVRSLIANESYVFAGCGYNKGVYSSTNNGENWTQTSLINQSVVSLAINGNHIFAGSLNNGIYLSTNNGQSWTQTGLNNTSVRALAISGYNPEDSGQVIFAGCDYPYGIYVSTNNGQNWTQTSLSNQDINSIAISGNNPEDSGQVIFAGTLNNIVYFSSNNGQNWTQTVLNSTWIYNLVINGNNIFAGTSSGIYQSSNNGQNWMLNAFFTHAVYSLTENGNSIFAGIGHGGVWHSTNNGQNWIQRNEGFSPIPAVHSLLITNDYIFAGTLDISVWRRPLSDLIGIKKISTEVPSAFLLEQNYPNPFNANTIIRFQIKDSRFVKLKVYDLNGREIRTLVNEGLNPGIYEVRFNVRLGGSSTDLPSGVYFYRMETEDFSETRKLILLK